MLQKESFYRDTLSEVSIYKQSSVRLVQQAQVKFYTQMQQKVKSEAQADGLKPSDNQERSSSQLVQPSFSYLITDLMLFHFQGTLMLIQTNEHGDCQLYDCETGVLQHAFVFDQAFNTGKATARVEKVSEKMIDSIESMAVNAIKHLNPSTMMGTTDKALATTEQTVGDQDTQMTSRDSDSKSKSSSPVRIKKMRSKQSSSRDAKSKSYVKQDTKSSYSIKIAQ